MGVGFWWSLYIMAWMNGWVKVLIIPQLSSSFGRFHYNQSRRID
ncbi:hypothetical protein AO368_1173 [Moraxella catarrhalis]|nr:hypothetical protein AO368_1173 [Moraxella catarrhalis]